MRFALSLSQDELNFLKKRNAFVKQGLCRLLCPSSPASTYLSSLPHKAMPSQFVPNPSAFSNTSGPEAASPPLSSSPPPTISFQGEPQEILFRKSDLDSMNVPTMAILSSGGGFRAMIAYSGAFKVMYFTLKLNCI